MRSLKCFPSNSYGMRFLRLGLQGPDVEAWQYFLRGLDPQSTLLATGTFDQATKLATQDFQRHVGFFGNDVDGVVGNLTYGKAVALGFSVAVDDSSDGDQSSPAWPARPDNVMQLAYASREQTFGKFSYVAAPITGMQEAIRITDGWAAQNIVTVNIPQLVGVTGASSSGNAQFHKLVAKQVQDTFAAWEAAGLKSRILTWGGSWVPRFIRGSNTVLSNHSWGTAFDINVPWNMLGAVPALKGQKGSVRELVDIAVQHGLFWGGWFSGRPDGMHFEAFKILP